MSSGADTLPMQGVLFMPHGWEVIISGREARTRAVQPLRADIERLSAALTEAHGRLADFHREHCPKGAAVADCDVCMGRS